MATLGFLFSPIEGRDFRALGYQWRLAGRVLARAYWRIGLMSEEDGQHGAWAVLRAARQGFVRRWGPELAAGWGRAEADEGVMGRVGGLAEAVWDGRRTIMRDAAAVAAGWALWIALWLGVAWAVLGAAVGTAMAATGAAATPDVAKGLLGDLLPFLGAGTALTKGLGQMAAVFSAAAFVIAGIAATWGAGVMVVDYTFTPGEARSHYSPWMFVLRIALALGLLAPVAGGWGLGQELVGAFGLWGSNKASDAWSTMVGYLTAGSKESWVAKPAVAETDVLQTIAGLVAADACMDAINDDPAKNKDARVRIVDDGNVTRFDYQLHHFYGWTTETRGGCGTITYPAAATGVGNAGAAVEQAHRAALQGLQGDIGPAVQTFVGNLIACRDSPTSCAATADPSVVAAWPGVYRAALDSDIATAFQAADAQARSAMAQAASDGGWVMAGSWGLQLTKFEGSIDAAGRDLPRVVGPQIAVANSAVTQALQWAAQGLSGDPLVVANTAAASGGESAADQVFPFLCGDIWTALTSSVAMNPLAGLASVGHAVYWAGIGIYSAQAIFGAKKTSGGASAKPGILRRVAGVVAGGLDFVREIPVVGRVVEIMGTAAGAVASGVWQILVAAALPMVLLGLALAYFVPALPFVRFFFGVVGWLIALFEAVMLLPIALVMLVTAERGGFLPQGAKAGLWMVGGVVVRPVLTLAGFVGGLALINAAVGLLNTLMVPMIAATQTDGAGIFGFLSYLVIFLGMAYVTVNTCAKLAEMLPMAAYRWIGANASGERDDASAVGVALGGVMGRLDRGGLMRPSGGVGK